jgi:4a-hydroxytetrahydrobiopterin dehydratase
MNDLSRKHCVPCRGGMPTLSDLRVDAHLGRPDLVGWKRRGEAIEKTFTFADFKQVMIFVNYVAEEAEKEGHHPDFSVFGYKNVKFSFTTHAVNGLTENDFIMAAKANWISTAYADLDLQNS